ncbi:ribulose-phosphate 3-epimerase [Natronogracilivirgula saccharolytica]|uniref:Ribulose-phosphate 3-epimerase n=2 Tax=Natronogracilivirga saccharolytica TaxID=2812953 RepID=A0A8J7UVM3_9BACT|nr:ribulose-phosphate 3-epimerase [Natronogracilivirga saccharolytica]
MHETSPPVVAPSILAANFLHLENDIRQAVDGGAPWIHCDIMDGHFVPNISFGPDVVETVRSATDVFLDVHLMIEDPDRYIADFARAGADLITVHVETCPHLHRTLQSIHELGCHAGVAINPGTALGTLRAALEDADLVLLMTVNPGFGGQKFIRFSYDRLRALRLMRQELNKSFLIEVDGGVSRSNASDITSAGADVLVAGSSVFKSSDIASEVDAIRNAAGASYRSDYV